MGQTIDTINSSIDHEVTVNQNIESIKILGKTFEMENKGENLETSIRSVKFPKNSTTGMQIRITLCDRLIFAKLKYKYSFFKKTIELNSLDDQNYHVEVNPVDMSITSIELNDRSFFDSMFATNSSWKINIYNRSTGDIFCLICTEYKLCEKN